MKTYNEWSRLWYVLRTWSPNRLHPIQNPWILIDIVLFSITLFCFQWEEKYVDIAILGFWVYFGCDE